MTENGAARDDLAETPAVDPRDLARGLEADARFRCEQCGNVTRFDVVTRERARRYLHYDLGGDAEVEEDEVLELAVESVTCRWCGREDMVRVEPAPTALLAERRRQDRTR